MDEQYAMNSIVKPTVGENIGWQIRNMEAQVERLKKIREQLRASGLLEISIGDLRAAVSF
jgi:hypothetical protein